MTINLFSNNRTNIILEFIILNFLLTNHERFLFLVKKYKHNRNIL